jgi:hypothetical protein
MNTKRVVLYIKDISLITGKSYKTAQRQYNKIKQENNLTKEDFLTVSMFCSATKIPVNDVILALNAKS